MLEHDKNLIEMRFQLVPKVTKEVDFWRNYFYRISLIKQSAEPIDLTDVVVEEAKVVIVRKFENSHKVYQGIKLGRRIRRDQKPRGRVCLRRGRHQIRGSAPVGEGAAG